MIFQENFSSTIGLFRKPTLPDLWLGGAFSSSCKVFFAVTGVAKLSVHQHIGLAHQNDFCLHRVKYILLSTLRFLQN